MATEKEYLDLTGLQTLVTNIKSEDEKRVPKSTATSEHSATFVKVGTNRNGLVENDDLVAVTKSDITGLGIPEADTNQTIKVGSSTFAVNDAVEIAAGSNVSVTADTTNKKITIAYTGVATDHNQTVKGNGTAFGADAAVDIKPGTNITVVADTSSNAITVGHATYSEATAAAVKVGRDGTGHVVIGDALSYNDLTNRPTIGDGTLTIVVGTTQAGTFKANQTTASTITITAKDLGLDSAMHFIGVGQTSAPTVGNYVHDKTTGLYIPKTTSGTLTEVDAAKGDVFINGNKEYVFITAGKYATPNASQELGDEGSHALKTITISAGTGLTGGGDLSANRTISHATYAEASAAAVKIGRNATGHVVIGDALGATSSSVPDHTHTVYGYVKVPTVASTSSTYGNTTGSTTVVTSYPGVFLKLDTKSITPANGSVSITPAVSAGNIVPAVAVASDSYPTKTVFGTSTTASKASAGTQVTYGNANVKSGTTNVVTGVTASSPAYNASYDDTTCCLTLNAITITAAKTAIQEAVASTAKLTPYTFTDVTVPVVSSNDSVEVAKAGTAVAVAKTGTAVYAAVLGDAVTVGTGSASTSGGGTSLMSGLGTANTASVLNKADFGTKTGGTALVNAVTVGSSTVSIQGGTTSAVGGHSHTITIS